MGRNYLAHSTGDAINAVFAAMSDLSMSNFPAMEPMAAMLTVCLSFAVLSGGRRCRCLRGRCRCLRGRRRRPARRFAEAGHADLASLDSPGFPA
jgi:hypothetical protein